MKDFFANILFICMAASVSPSEFDKLKYTHKPGSYSPLQIQKLYNLSDWKHFEQVLDTILVPRVVGTPSHEAVARFIGEQMKSVGWALDHDQFEAATPHGDKVFTNIIATLNPHAERFLVLACHYDSKYFRNGRFVGATDSAVPCSMMLNLAKVLKTEFDQVKNKTDLSLKFIFFDGEEAFVTWSSTDSIYGARHLAETLKNSVTAVRSGEPIRELQKFDVLVLLDLLGAPNPSFYSYFSEFKRWYTPLCDSEYDLNSLNLLHKTSGEYFKRRSKRVGIEDDHLPFYYENVPILHIIPHQFPYTWHTLKDDKDHLDMNSIEDLSLILRVYVAKYLHIEIEDPVPSDSSKVEL